MRGRIRPEGSNPAARTGANMLIVLPANAAETPADYLDQLYLELPRLFANGGTQEQVTTLFGGLAAALEGALDTAHGENAEIRMFPLPWGWAPDHGKADAVAFDLAAAGVDLADPRPDYLHGDSLGLLFVPDAGGGWKRWNPANGPAPKPKDGHIRVAVVLLRAGSDGATVCQMREVFGRDKSLRAPLYKPAMTLAPASASESAHLMVTLRSLLSTGMEA
jgi:hypothetical protein